MKHLLSIPVVLLLAVCNITGQSPLTIVLEEQNFPNLPGLQSYVIGEADGKWLVMGGRKDGLHRRQPFAAFDAAGNNANLYVIDPVLQSIWSQPLNSLPTSIAEQLQSTNMEFRQIGNTLYVIGGYGYSSTADDHITHPYLVAVDVAGVINAVIDNQPLPPHFRQTEDARIQVTGGYLDWLNGYFTWPAGKIHRPL
ncbi:MAG: hypothetical protein IPJ82_02350 [Lewinellaceae bacterium]|nr:hypothetical protein [Lewinellaceae bacterium]